MPYIPDEHFAYCVAQAGPSPWMHFVRGALKLHDAGFGSKSWQAVHGRQAMSEAMVALNGQPLAFFGGLTREETHRYPGDDRPASEVPDALEVLERKLAAPESSLAYVVHDRGWTPGGLIPGHSTKPHPTRAAALLERDGPCEGDGNVYIVERENENWRVIAVAIPESK